MPILALVAAFISSERRVTAVLAPMFLVPDLILITDMMVVVFTLRIASPGWRVTHTVQRVNRQFSRGLGTT
ncbi:MAG: hypothetical protein WAU48_03845 [Gammaproteobacteria bacterium]|jgi:hypothetical protein